MVWTSNQLLCCSLAATRLHIIIAYVCKIDRNAGEKWPRFSSLKIIILN
jgi:hypothetical protein